MLATPVGDAQTTRVAGFVAAALPASGPSSWADEIMPVPVVAASMTSYRIAMVPTAGLWPT